MMQLFTSMQMGCFHVVIFVRIKPNKTNKEIAFVRTYKCFAYIVLYYTIHTDKCIRIRMKEMKNCNGLGIIHWMVLAMPL